MIMYSAACDALPAVAMRTMCSDCRDVLYLDAHRQHDVHPTALYRLGHLPAHTCSALQDTDFACTQIDAHTTQNAHATTQQHLEVRSQARVVREVVRLAASAAAQVLTCSMGAVRTASQSTMSKYNSVASS